MEKKRAIAHWAQSFVVGVAALKEALKVHHSGLDTLGFIMETLVPPPDDFVLSTPQLDPKP